MVQDLRIIGPKTITSVDSDISSNYTLPATQVSGFTNTANNDQIGARNASYGNGAYYSWYAATAGTGTAEISSGNAASSICPKGWQLPEGGSSVTKSFNNLIAVIYGIMSSSAGSIVLQAHPLQFVLAGGYSTAGFINGGSYADYWSSSVYDAQSAHNLAFNKSFVNPQRSDGKFFGVSVRCVAR